MLQYNNSAGLSYYPIQNRDEVKSIIIKHIILSMNCQQSLLQCNIIHSKVKSIIIPWGRKDYQKSGQL